MIINIVYIIYMLTFHSKYYSPIPGYFYRIIFFKITFQGMKIIPWNIHLMRKTNGSKP